MYMLHIYTYHSHTYTTHLGLHPRGPAGRPRCRYALFSATYSDQIMANVRDFVPRTHKRLVIQLHKNEVRRVSVCGCVKGGGGW